MASPRVNLIAQCIVKVSSTLTKMGAYAPRTNYMGRSFNLNASGDVESGTVKTLCGFLTASGLERFLEVPVVIHQGEVLNPAVAFMNGRMHVLSEDLIKAISDAGTIKERGVPGHMYSTAYVNEPDLYKEIRDNMPARAKLYKPLY